MPNQGILLQTETPIRPDLGEYNAATRAGMCHNLTKVMI